MATAAKKSPFGKPSAKEAEFEFVVPEQSGLRIPASDSYVGKCTGVIKDKAKSSGNPMYVWDFVITKGPYAGKDFRIHTALTPNAMWKVVETLAAFGISGEVGETIKFAKTDVVGKLVLMNIQDDEYNGRPTSKLQGILPHPSGAGKTASKGNAEVSGEAESEDDEEPTRLEDEEPEEQEEEAAEEEGEIDLNDLDRSQLKALIKEQDLNVRVTKSMSDDDIRKQIAEALGQATEEVEEEEEEEEEEEPTPPKKVTAGKAPSTLGKKK